MRVFTAVQQLQVGKCLLLQSDEHTGYQLLVQYGITFQLIGHYIIYVLDEDYISIKIVQVFNQRAMPTRTEQELAVIAERLVLHIGGNGIGARLLLGETDVVVHTVFLGIGGRLLVHQRLEQCTMFGRYGEVNIHLAVLIGRIKRTFHQMFLQRSTGTVFVFVELQQPFRERTVVQPCRLKQCSNHCLVISGSQQCGNVLTGCFQASGVQVIIESKLLDFLKECFLEPRLGSVVVCSKKFKQILEHTACRTRCRNKFHNSLVRLGVCFPCIQVFFLFIGIRNKDTLSHRSGGK